MRIIYPWIHNEVKLTMLFGNQLAFNSAQVFSGMCKMVLHILEQESSLVSVILPPVPRGCLPCTLFLNRPLFLEEAWNFHPAKFQNKWCSSLEVAGSKVDSHWILCELEVYVVPIPCCRNLSSSILQSHRRWPPRLFQLLDVSDSLQFDATKSPSWSRLTFTSFCTSWARLEGFL